MIELLSKIFQMHGTGLWKAFIETNFMLWGSMSFSLLFSLPLGFLLYSFRKESLYKSQWAYQMLSFSLNLLRSIPFLLFVFILIPITRALLGTSFGNGAALVPLTLVSISHYTRFIEQALLSVPDKIMDRAVSMGATKGQMILYFLLPSIKQDLVLSFTSTSISVLAYSTVMGIIGAGGLGEYAYRYGYQEYDYPLMYLIVLFFILYVYIIQTFSYFIIHYMKKRRFL